MLKNDLNILFFYIKNREIKNSSDYFTIKKMKLCWILLRKYVKNLKKNVMGLKKSMKFTILIGGIF